MMANRTKIGNRVRELRQGKFTVRQLADVLKKTPGYISRIEAQGEIPSAEFICTLATELGANEEELLELAKTDRLGRVEEEIDERNKHALILHRKAK